LFKYIFGPVYSRRLGLSLGIDLLGKKICSFNCVYCEVRKTEVLTLDRKPYVSADKIVNEIDLFFSQHPNIKLNYITFSGQGEPTLNSDISKVIEHLKRNYSFPICVLTNGSLLHNKDVRKDLLRADLIIPSLDALSNTAFSRINHPHHSIKVDLICEGIKKLREEFSGLIWLEILFVQGINNNEDEILLLIDKIKELKPDKVYVNTVHRPPAFLDVHPINESELKNIQSIFDSVINNKLNNDVSVKSFPESINISTNHEILMEKIKPMLSIRPCTLEDLYKIFHSYDSCLKEDTLKCILKNLVENKVLKTKEYDNSKFYYFEAR